MTTNSGKITLTNGYCTFVDNIHLIKLDKSYLVGCVKRNTKDLFLIDVTDPDNQTVWMFHECSQIPSTHRLAAMQIIDVDSAPLKPLIYDREAF